MDCASRWLMSDLEQCPLTDPAGPTDLEPKEQIVATASLLLGCLLLLGLLALKGPPVAQWLASSFTSSMARLPVTDDDDESGIFAESTGTLLAVRSEKEGLQGDDVSACSDRRVQVAAAGRLKEVRSSLIESDVELLDIISEPLRAEVRLQAFSPVLTRHPLFDRIHDRALWAMQKICHTCVSQMKHEEGDILFRRNEVPSFPTMLFVTGGLLEYTQDGLTKSALGCGHWLCEPVLWTRWVFHGNLTAKTLCRSIAISARPFWHLQATGQISDLGLGRYSIAYITGMNADKSTRTEVGDFARCLELVLQAYG